MDVLAHLLTQCPVNHLVLLHHGLTLEFIADNQSLEVRPIITTDGNGGARDTSRNQCFDFVILHSRPPMIG